jgi:pimeloyl-ACP methyl ester carboxylesterase
VNGPASVVSTRQVSANGIEINVTTAGSGPAILLLHGFPHTWELWSRVIPKLAETHFVIAPDLRGHGGTTRAAEGYDLTTLGHDALELLDVFGVVEADVMAMDVGASTAFYLALAYPERIRRLVIMEAIIGDLPRPGIPDGLRPWWFGFHGVPGLAETVLEGHEDDYLGFFLDNGVRNGPLDPHLRSRFIDAYRGKESLRCGFQFWRYLEVNARLIDDALAQRRLTVPTLAVGSSPIGGGLHAQLQPYVDNLAGELIEDCGHAIPLDRPVELLKIIEKFLVDGVSLGR